MQYQDIISMVTNKQVGNNASIGSLNSLIEKYPYCATFHVLKAIALKEQDSIELKSQLKVASVYIQDRSNLYDYIVKENLLKTVNSSSESSSIVEENITPTKTDVEMPQDSTANHHLAGTRELPSASKESEPLISSSPMEEEIMREAVMQVGELEATQLIEQLSKLPRIESEKAEIQREITSAPKSFGEWLLNLEGADEKPQKTEIEQSLIDKFIQESPQISPVKNAFFSPAQMGKMSLVDDDSFVTETLAKIYMRQGDHKKAASAYENLKLKYPEKSIYFANLQKQAEEKLKN